MNVLNVIIKIDGDLKSENKNDQLYYDCNSFRCGKH